MSNIVKMPDRAGLYSPELTDCVLGLYSTTPPDDEFIIKEFDRSGLVQSRFYKTVILILKVQARIIDFLLALLDNDVIDSNTKLDQYSAFGNDDRCGSFPTTLLNFYTGDGSEPPAMRIMFSIFCFDKHISAADSRLREIRQREFNHLHVNDLDGSPVISIAVRRLLEIGYACGLYGDLKKTDDGYDLFNMTLRLDAPDSPGLAVLSVSISTMPGIIVRDPLTHSGIENLPLTRSLISDNDLLMQKRLKSALNSDTAFEYLAFLKIAIERYYRTRGNNGKEEN